jgi:hypothetical protein
MVQSGMQICTSVGSNFGANREVRTMSRSSNAAAPFIIGLVIFGALALGAGPAFEWLKTQFLNKEEAANQMSEKQNRRKWCADVFESESISQADHTYCADIWQD